VAGVAGRESCAVLRLGMVCFLFCEWVGGVLRSFFFWNVG